MKKDKTTYMFAATYFSSILGEATSLYRVEDDIPGLAWLHDSIPTNEDGTMPYALSLDSEGAWINGDLPSELWYQLIGYCSVHNIDWMESTGLRTFRASISRHEAEVLYESA